MMDETTEEHIHIIENIFYLYVTDKEKEFDLKKIKYYPGTSNTYVVWGCIVPPTPTILLRYNHDNVEIKYYSRYTKHLGDTDIFTDYSVYINNKLIVDVEYQ